MTAPTTLPAPVEAPPAPRARPTAREILAALIDLPPLLAPGTVAPALAGAVLVPVLAVALRALT